MDKKQALLIVFAVAVVAAVVVILVLRPSGAVAPVSPVSQSANVPASVPPPMATSTTMAPVPQNVVVPNKGATETLQNVAVPQVEIPASPSSSAQYLSFNINADAGQFTPSTIIVKQNDVVDIEFTAVDQNYDFTQPDYGFYAQISRGQTKKLEFSPSVVGKFTFYCSSCGGPAKGPVGYLIVTAR